MDEIVYLTTLHQFNYNYWISFALKPKAKDLKTIVEDLNSMEFLFKLSDYRATIVLDGKKVRIGFEG